MVTTQYAVLDRFSGKGQFTAEIECDADASIAVKLGLAVRWAITSRANLSRADLSGADLSGANLSRADLSGADLGEHKLAAGASLITLGRPDGWAALTYLTEKGEQRIKVGCRDFTLSEARAYWANKDDRREVLACADYAETLGCLRNWDNRKAKQSAEVVS